MKLTFLIVILLLLSCFQLNNADFSIFNVSSFFHSIFSFDEYNMQEVIFREIRIPRTFITIIAGSSLAISGLLLQTFFNNPLAGPSVLGISSGASLFVGLYTLIGFDLLFYDLSLILSSLLGSILFCFIIILFSYIVRNNISLLLIGMMLGSFSNAIIQLFQLNSTAQDLKLFTLWSFGSLQQLNFSQIPMVFFVFCIAIFMLVFLIKPLNSLILGERELQLVGIKIKHVKILLVLCSSILTGLITAFCGPIAFVGLAVPNITKQVIKTQDHTKLIVYTAIIGAIFLLICDICIILLQDLTNVPLNAITSLIGAPFVIWIILKKIK